MIRKSVFLAGGIGTVTVLALVLYVLSGQVIDLVALERVDIYQSGRGTKPNSIIGSLAKGQKAVVIECVVQKDDFTPVVRLADGRIGYVIGGRIRLERTRASPSDFKRIAHGCG